MLDPRTVSPQTILRKTAGRPAASIVAFDTSDGALPIAGDGSRAPVQVIVAAGQLCPAFVNRSASAVVGEVVVFVFGGALSHTSLDVILTRFRDASYLGMLWARQAGLRGTTRHTGARRPPPGCVLALRGDLWAALGGLDDGYGSLAWALRDLFLRARAIGYVAPRVIPRTLPDASASNTRADGRRYRGRLSTAPDRSRPRKSARTGVLDSRRAVVYTAIAGGYDTLKPQSVDRMGSASLVAFLDAATASRHGGRYRGWRAMEAIPPSEDPHRASRFYKVNAHLASPESTVSLWIDASISIVFPFSFERLIELFLADADICVFRHYARRSIYEEAEACKARGLDDPAVIDAQMDRYRREGLPETSGLAELPVLLRRHTRAVRALNEAWWNEILAGSRRDQLSFAYVAWKLGVRYATFPLSLAARNGLFLKFRRHTTGGMDGGQRRAG